MKLGINICTVLLFAPMLIIVHGQQPNDDCKADAGPIGECVQWISTNCDNATFITDKLEYIDVCPMFTIFWDEPYYNLTILFESHLLKPYELCVTPVGCTKAFRMNDDGQEVAIDWDTTSLDPVCFGTKRADMPTMKFRFDAQHQTRCMRTFINFHYE
ncbi:unnamed protein product [Rotaria magnacalcarata]|uniref:Uncharacterized protein n=2 Tax=Rotaria magnacalcarata TaxID=392030 RepID=A0A816ZW76_9BILA|nr:unnamed protein product [Rotaria magnacalcarata]CAF4260293.1 unnamed protein product [Rotaria magnacalcarata]